MGRGGKGREGKGRELEEWVEVEVGVGIPGPMAAARAS